VDERLTKAERIRRRVDYLRIQNSGRKLHAASFVCFGILQDSRLPEGAHEKDCPARLGITVSRRVGGAVVRNRVKRLVREAFRRHKSMFPAGMELVLIARPEAAKAAWGEVERQLCDVGRRISSGARPRP